MKTKYDMNEVVWFMSGNCPTARRVQAIAITLVTDEDKDKELYQDGEYRVQYKVYTDYYWPEHKLYPSRSALMEAVMEMEADERF